MPDVDLDNGILRMLNTKEGQTPPRTDVICYGGHPDQVLYGYGTLW